MKQNAKVYLFFHIYTHLYLFLSLYKNLFPHHTIASKSTGWSCNTHTRDLISNTPIFSWWFHSNLWRACTLASLMNEMLWLVCSTLSQSLAIWMKNLLAPSKCCLRKSLKGSMCCSLLNSTWLAMFCRILDISISPRFTCPHGWLSRMPVSQGETAIQQGKLTCNLKD